MCRLPSRTCVRVRPLLASLPSTPFSLFFLPLGRVGAVLTTRNVCGRFSVDVKGFDSTIGYTQWANKPAERDAAVRFSFFPSSFPLLSSLSPTSLPIAFPVANRSSRSCAQQAPSSSPRRTCRRRFSPLRVRTRSGAARSARGRPRTARAARPAAKARCSRRTAPCSASAPTSAGAYAFRRGTAGYLGSSRATGGCRTQALLVRLSVPFLVGHRLLTLRSFLFA